MQPVLLSMRRKQVEDSDVLVVVDEIVIFVWTKVSRKSWVASVMQKEYIVIATFVKETRNQSFSRSRKYYSRPTRSPFF